MQLGMKSFSKNFIRCQNSVCNILMFYWPNRLSTYYCSAMASSVSTRTKWEELCCLSCSYLTRYLECMLHKSMLHAYCLLPFYSIGNNSKFHWLTYQNFKWNGAQGIFSPSNWNLLYYSSSRANFVPFHCNASDIDHASFLYVYAFIYLYQSADPGVLFFSS